MRAPDLTFYHLLPSGESIKADVWQDDCAQGGMEVTSTCNPEEIPGGEVKAFFDHVGSVLEELSEEASNG